MTMQVGEGGGFTSYTVQLRSWPLTQWPGFNFFFWIASVFTFVPFSTCGIYGVVIMEEDERLALIYVFNLFWFSDVLGTIDVRGEKIMKLEESRI